MGLYLRQQNICLDGLQQQANSTCCVHLHGGGHDDGVTGAAEEDAEENEAAVLEVERQAHGDDAEQRLGRQLVLV